MFFFVSLYLNEENNFVNECVDVVVCHFELSKQLKMDGPVGRGRARS
jgi:hypothetical protein